MKVSKGILPSLFSVAPGCPEEDGNIRDMVPLSY